MITGLTVDQDPESLFSEGLTGKSLAERLGVDAGSITRNWGKGPKHFAKWSREGQAVGTAKGHKLPDPDNLSWERRGVRYFPIIDKD